MAYNYSKRVLEHFRNPKNVGELKKADGKATVGSPACGDMITLSMRVNPETKRIEDIRFKSYGCASNIATASVLTEIVKGKTIEEAKQLEWRAVTSALGGLPNVKLHCSVLAINSLKQAIADYEKRHNLAEEGRFQLTPEAVMEELSHIINPDIGVNIVKLKMIKALTTKDGRVRVRLSLGNTDPIYAENIKEEIKEHASSLPGVKQVEVRID